MTVEAIACTLPYHKALALRERSYQHLRQMGIEIGISGQHVVNLILTAPNDFLLGYGTGYLASQAS